jgi:hypothetical protein
MITAGTFERVSGKEGTSQMTKNDTANAPDANSRSVVGAAGVYSIVARNDRPGNRFERPESVPSPGLDEVLVVDDRAALRPAQVVESKLARLLQDASLPVSHLQMRGLLKTR